MSLSNPLSYQSSVLPMERFRAILAALKLDQQSFTDAFWLRFAAQIAVQHPDEPAVLAQRITVIAQHVATHAAWYQPLASPLRFVIAAWLLRHDTKLNTFLAEYRRIGDQLDHVGLRHGGRYEPLTVLIVMSGPDHDAFSLLEAERLKVLHQHLKGFHWWITGRDDMPAIAALAQLSGHPEVIAAQTEAIYQQLTDSGCQAGNYLQTAAYLLLLTGLSPAAAAQRWLVLKQTIEAAHIPVLPVHYDALSVLSLLAQPPAMIIARHCSIHRELNLMMPDLAGNSSFTLAADLTANDLIRYDADGTALTNVAYHAALRALHVATMVQISQVDIDFAVMNNVQPLMAWPYPV